MSHVYQAVGWNRQKRLYDTTVAVGVVAYVGLFVGLGAGLFPTATAETLIIRGVGSAAFFLLHIILGTGEVGLAAADLRDLLHEITRL